MTDTSKNIGAVLYGPKNFKIENVKIQEPANNEVQVAVAKVGICDSDVHFYSSGSINGRFPMRRALVMGHEFGGKIVALGKDVTKCNIGDRVAVEPGVPCRQCEFCHQGRYNLCPDQQFFATTCHGSLQNFVNIASDFCFKIPDSMSDEEAALVEPVSVAVGAVRRAGVSPGHVCLIHGAGAIGLALHFVAKAAGCSKTVFTDINKGRLEFVKTLGSDIETILLERTSIQEKMDYYNNESPSRKLAKQIIEVAGAETNICFDTTGAQWLLETSVICLKKAGTLMLVGYPQGELSRIPYADIVRKEIDIRSIFRYNNTYQAAVDLVATKSLSGIAKMIRHTFSLQECAEAFETAINYSKTGAIKIMIDCEPKN